jgi:hypothetical protein
MKRNTRIGFGAFAVAILAAVGCTDDFTDINTNPNAPTAVPVQYLLPAGIQDAVNDLLGTGFDRGTASTWVQHYAALQYTGTDRYDIGPTFGDGTWSGLYTGALVDFDKMVDLATETGNANQQAVGMIMREWMFMNMTDLWGDIPYSEALGGSSEGGTITPRYDTQADVYAGILANLTAASGMINPSEPLFPDVFRGTIDNPDLIYGGEMGMWRKFANSLRLRAAMRLAEVDQGTASSAASAAVNAGVFESSADDAMLAYPGVPPNENPMAPAFKARPGDYRISNSLVDTLLALNDPRLPVYADVNRDGEYVGMPNGLVEEHGIAFEAVSRVGELFLEPDQPAWIMSYAEVLFLRAEAAQRGFAGGVAADLYEQGIRASMGTYGISSGAVDTYLEQPGVVYDPAQGLAQIGVQMWIALYDQGPEAYAYWRRTGYPSMTPARDNLNNGQIPVRLPYSSTEQSLNNTNLQEAMSRQGFGVGEWNTRVWWDVTPNVYSGG